MFNSHVSSSLTSVTCENFHLFVYLIALEPSELPESIPLIQSDRDRQYIPVLLIPQTTSYTVNPYTVAYQTTHIHSSTYSVIALPSSS
jgi:hypothetical protein